MARTVEKVLFLLAASGLSMREIKQALADLREIPEPMVAEFIRDLRKTVSYTQFRADRPQFRRSQKNSLKFDLSVAPRVEYMLRKEAGLTVGLAAGELLNSLMLDQPDVSRIFDVPNKESFVRWLNKLLRHVGPNVLLHHATMVRDRHAPPASHDWPLRK